MNKIAIIIPTRGRPDKVGKMLANIKATTTLPYEVYFGIDPDDSATIAACRELKANAIVNQVPSKYGPTINNCYHKTSEPFLMLGADDIEFTQGWDREMMACMDDPKIGIVGHYDNWPIGKTGKHGSHLLIRRDYIRTYSGVEDEADTIYSTAYYHYNTDIETEQTAMKRGAFVMSNAVIHHHHWCNGEVPKDETYIRAMNDNMVHDIQVYNQRRKRFEQYYLESLQLGKIIPVNTGKLSVVIASYNAPAALQMTLQSLYANTYNDFELILVDDHSTDPRTREYINGISQANIKRFLLPEQGFTTHAWNFGVNKATGDYIVVANNDITFSKHWDVHLINALNQPRVYLANPYQTDDGCTTPYGFAERAGGINIRGTCYAMSRESMKALFPLPENLVMWFSDYWLAEKVQKLHKKSVFVPEAVVHTLGSRSSNDLERETGKYWWILRGDALEFEKMTGLDVSHWYEVIKAHLPYGKKV